MNKLYTLTVFLLLFCLRSQGQTTISWIGGASGEWGLASNWSPANVPDAATEIARFATGGSPTVTVTDDLILGGLVVTTNTNLTLVPTLAGNRTISIQDFAGQPDLQVAVGSQLSISGADFGNLDTELALQLESATTEAIIAGILTVTTADASNSSANGNIRLSTGTFTFPAGGEYRHNRDGGVINFNSATTFNAASTVRITGIRASNFTSLLTVPSISFGNLVIDLPQLTTVAHIAAASVTNITVQGNVQVLRTGSVSTNYFSLNHVGSALRWQVLGNVQVGAGQFAWLSTRSGAANTTVSTLALDGNLTVNSGASFYQHNSTVNYEFGVAGGLQNSIVEGAGTISINSGGAISRLIVGPYGLSHTLSLDRNLTFSGSGTVQENSVISFLSTAARTLRITGHLSGAGTIDMSPGNRAHILLLNGAQNQIANFVCGRGIVRYDGNDQQVMGGHTYWELNMQGVASSTKSIFPAGDTVQILGTLSLTAGTFDGTSGTVLMNNGSTVSRAENATYVGNPLQTASPSARYNVAYLALTNTRLQTTGPEWNGAVDKVANVSLSLGVGNYLLLSEPKTIHGTLTLTSGLLTLNSHDLTMADGAAFAGATANGYVVTNGSGSLIKLGDTNADFVRAYPVGSGGFYTPITINNINITGTGGILLRSTGHRHPMTRKVGTLNRYFTLGLTGGLVVNSWSGNFVHGIGEGPNTTNTVAHLPNQTATNWTTAPNGASYSLVNRRLTILANTTRFQGIWTAGINGVGQSFDIAGAFIAVNDGDWFTNTTWAGNLVPDATSVVVVNAHVNVDASVTVATISVENIGSITLGNQNITVTGDLLLEGALVDTDSTGDITIGGDLVVAAPFNIGTQPIRVNGNLYLNYDGLNIAGPVTLGGGAAHIYGTSRAQLNNLLAVNESVINVATSAFGSGLVLNGVMTNAPSQTAGRFRMATNGILTLLNSVPNGITTGPDATDVTNFDFTATGSRVRYSSIGSQTLISTAYNRLEISQAGDKVLGSLPDGNQTQAISGILIEGTATLRSGATSADSLIIGNRTTGVAAAITNAAGNLNLANGKLVNLVSYSTVSPWSGTGSHILGHVWFKAPGTTPPNFSIPNGYQARGNFIHLAGNTISHAVGASCTFNPGTSMGIFSANGGGLTFANFRVRGVNTEITLHTPIRVIGNGVGFNSTASDAAFGIDAANNCRLNVNGYSITFASTTNNSTIYLTNGRLDMSVPGSELNIQVPVGNTAVVRGTYPVLPLDGFKVSQGTGRFLMPTELRRPMVVNGIADFNGVHTISHIPAPADELGYVGTGTVLWTANATILSGARLNSQANIQFQSSTFTNNSEGIDGISVYMPEATFSMNRAGTAPTGVQTMVSPLANGKLVIGTFTVDGTASKFLPEGEVQALSAMQFGPGIGPLETTGTTGTLRVGSATDANAAFLNSQFMQLNLQNSKVILHGAGDVFRTSYASPLFTNVGVMEVSTSGSSPLPATTSGSFSIATEFIHNSHNNFTMVGTAKLRSAHTGGSSFVSGASTGVTTLGAWWLGNGIANSTTTLRRSVTVADSLIINFSNTGSYLDLGNSTLTIAGTYAPIANQLFRGAPDGDVANTTGLVLQGDKDVLGTIRFQTGFRNLNTLVYDKSETNYMLGTPIRMVGLEPRLRLLQGMLGNSGANNISFAPSGVLVTCGGGTASAAFNYTDQPSVDWEITAPLDLNFLPMPAMASNSLNNLTINTGGPTVGLGSTSRRIIGKLTLESGIFSVTNATLVVHGEVARNTGTMSTTNLTNLEFRGTVPQVIPSGFFTTPTPWVNNLTVANTSPVGITLEGNGMEVYGNVTFTNDATYLHTPLDESKVLELVNGGRLINEGPGRYVVGAVASRRIAQPNTTMDLGHGVVIQGINALNAPTLNSIGGSLRAIRYAGRINHISNGNLGFEANQSIRRLWRFSPVGQLPSDVHLTLNWTAEDDNNCGTACDITKMIIFRRPNDASPWERIRTAGPDHRWSNADLGNGQRSISGFTGRFTDYTVAYYNSPLPVTWSGIAAKAIGTKGANAASVQVTWSTASELNNSHFVVERSTDNANFIAIGRVEGAGTTQQARTYNFLDEQATFSTDGQVYYRIRQVDYDGKNDLSPSAVASLTEATGNTSIRLWPQPSNRGQVVNLNIGTEEPVSITVMDVQGRVVSTYSGILQNQQLPAELVPMQPGTYMLNITTLATTQRLPWVIR